MCASTLCSIYNKHARLYISIKGANRICTHVHKCDSLTLVYKKQVQWAVVINYANKNSRYMELYHRADWPLHYSSRAYLTAALTFAIGNEQAHARKVPLKERSLYHSVDR